MSEILGKWIRQKVNPFPGLWFEFRNDGSLLPNMSRWE